MGTLLFIFTISYVSIKSIIIENNKTHLKNSISLIALNLSEVKELELYALNVSRNTNLRVTVIDRAGVVIAESDYEKNDMDNHAKREEILKAQSGEFSAVIRYSKTLKTESLYMAKKFHYKEKDIYLRVSSSLSQMMDSFYSLYFTLFIVILITITLSFYISKTMSKRVLSDIAQITNYLNEISKKNYEAVIKIEHFYEFLQISVMLKNLVKKLNAKEKQKQKYIDKLREMNKKRAKDKRKK